MISFGRRLVVPNILFEGFFSNLIKLVYPAMSSNRKHSKVLCCSNLKQTRLKVTKYKPGKVSEHQIYHVQSIEQQVSLYNLNNRRGGKKENISLCL